MGYLYKKIFTSIRCDIFDTQNNVSQYGSEISD